MINIDYLSTILLHLEVCGYTIDHEEKTISEENNDFSRFYCYKPVLEKFGFKELFV